MDMNQSIPGLTIHEAGLCLSLLPATVYFATAAEVLSGNICSILWKILLWNWKGWTYTFLWAPRWFRPAFAQQTALVGDHFREERVGHRWIIFSHSSSLLSRLPKSARSSWNIKSRFIQFGFANLLPAFTSLCLSHVRQHDLGSIMPSSCCSRPHSSQSHYQNVKNKGHVICRWLQGCV